MTTLNETNKTLKDLSTMTTTAINKISTKLDLTVTLTEDQLHIGKDVSRDSIMGSSATPVAERVISRLIAPKSSGVSTMAETAIEALTTKDVIILKIVSSRGVIDVDSQGILRGIAQRLAVKWVTMVMMVVIAAEELEIAVIIIWINNTINNTIIMIDIDAAIRLWTTKAIQMMKLMVNP